MPESFVHLHCHSEFSLLDGLGRIGDLVSASHDAKAKALALTDHGTMFGAIDFYSKARESDVKPIIGCEVYVSDRPLEERADTKAQNYHLVLLAENETGYRNLVRLTTEAHLRGFYRKPRVDHALLEQHSDGLICLSACANGEVARLISADNLAGAEEKADWHRQVFQDRYYLELQDHNLEFQKGINEGVVQVSRRLGVPLVATNDVHYVRAKQARTHEILLCIQTQSTLQDPKRMRFDTEEFYMKSAQEMSSLFSAYPEAISNTLLIAERCNLELSFGRPQLPHFETPDGKSSEEHLRALCEAGVHSRYSGVSAEIRERLDYELRVIFETGFVDYFLLVHDVIAHARSQGIGVGPGRGSAAGSIVAYVLHVTNVDPIAHQLSFERFLNPARVTMPDMDLDFADDRREEVIQYVTAKYGRDRVAQIITFGTLGVRGGVRDVGRTLGMSYSDVDRVAKLIPFACAKVSTARREVAELQQLYDGDPAMKDLLDVVEDLEGVARHASTHAAGVVIGRDPLSDVVPLYKVPKNEQITTQYSMAAIEKIGLLKMDFLGLRTLTILQRAVGMIRRSTGEELELDDISLDDPRIYELLSAGETFGVFQVDGSGMRRLLCDLKPTEFKHIVALVALYRPGPMEHIGEFAARKNGLREVSYIHPALEEVLQETYGIVVYQDQVMRLAVRVAGYSMGEADLLRRAMAKKKPEELARHRESFIQRAAKLGTEEHTARELFDIIEPFSGYAFPKAHAAAYAVITCQTAYLKAHYPREYMAALLSAEKENADKVAEAMAECRRLGVVVHGPDINRSLADFSLEDGGIRFGLSAVKHVGTGAIEAIVAARERNGAFTSISNFCTRIDWLAVNKRVLESLIRCGAMGCLKVERGRLLESLDRIVAYGTQLQRAAAMGQGSLFGAVDESVDVLQLAICTPATAEACLDWELELLGTYISPHPLTEAESVLQAMDVTMVSGVSPDFHGQRIRVGGVIKTPRSFPTRQGQQMGSFQLSDLRSSVEVLIFARSYEKLQAKMSDTSIVVVEGKFDAQEGRARLLADNILSIEEAREHPMAQTGAKAKNGSSGVRQDSKGKRNGQRQAGETVGESRPCYRLTIELRRSGNRDEDIQRVVTVYAALQRYPGEDEVDMVVLDAQRTTALPLPNKNVGFCDQLEKELRGSLEEGSWRVHVVSPVAGPGVNPTTAR